MESKLLKIKLKAGSRSDIDSLVAYMRTNITYPRNEMSQKGYYWDSIFVEQGDKVDFLYIVIKSEDFSKIMVDESELLSTPFRQVYDDFKAKCWLPGPYEDLEPVFCFNSAMQFSNG